MKIVKKIAWVLLLILLVAQFFSPEKNNGEVTSLTAFVNETNPSDEVLKILKESCFDCHSDKTRYPWYNKITPVNYWLASHVNEGKDELNFSNWKTYSLKRKEHKFDEVHEMVEKKEMPLPSYTWTHSEANLSEEQIQAIANWAKEIQKGYQKELKAE